MEATSICTMVSILLSACYWCEHRTADDDSGVIPQLEKGDVLGHEFCGVVESIAPSVTSCKVGDRVVASFPIACGQCRNCQMGLTSACERTNSNTITNAMYGKRTSGTSHSMALAWMEILTFSSRYLRVQSFHRRVCRWTGRICPCSQCRCQSVGPA